MELVFATGNLNKLREAQEIITNHKILSLKDINCFDDIPETGNTIIDNAKEKALYLWNKYKRNCFSDDTGLEVEALGGEPGVYSARYAGEGKNSEDNMNKLLKNLEGTENRKARFFTVVALVLNGKVHCFEGIVNGVITKEKHGKNGFGYDPVFMPEGYDKTLAEISAEEKNKISHRGAALRKMGQFLLQF
jgi:XTP/dITP diphosphohydrolase